MHAVYVAFHIQCAISFTSINLFWTASAFAIVLLIIEISNESLDAKSIALLGVLTAIVAALRP